MSDHLDKLRAKIAALKSKTTSAGCTEAEALAAAEMAARIMAEHGISDADVDMGAARARETTVSATWRTHIAQSIQVATNTACVLRVGFDEIEFLGRDPWPEVAAYLYGVMVRAVNREVRRFKAGEDYRRRRTVSTRRAAVADFTTGITLRLRLSLLKLFRITISEPARAQAKQALALRRPCTMKIGAPQREVRFLSAMEAGFRAGGNVTLSHGVAGPDGRPLAIGK